MAHVTGSYLVMGIDELSALWEERGLRAGLEKAIGGRLSDDAWRAIVASELPSLSDFSVGDLRDLIRDLRDLAQRQADVFPIGARSTERVRRDVTLERDEELLDPRWQAVAEILALEAEEDDGVRCWRDQHLPDGLCDPAVIDDLIRELAWQEVHETSRAKEAVSFGEVLDYRSAEGELRRWIGVGPVGPLHDLRLIARRLAEEFHWVEADAVTFVLTDSPPPFFAISIRLRIDERAVTSRVLLDADPRVSPSTIAEAFEWARRCEAFDDIAIPKRLRSVHPKLARLAVFLARDDGQSWRERREHWNAAEPTEHYGTEREFARDARRAWFAVMGEKLPEVEGK
jgi:hypothetical protein